MVSRFRSYTSKEASKVEYGLNLDSIAKDGKIDYDSFVEMAKTMTSNMKSFGKIAKIERQKSNMLEDVSNVLPDYIAIAQMGAIILLNTKDTNNETKKEVQKAIADMSNAAEKAFTKVGIKFERKSLSSVAGMKNEDLKAIEDANKELGEKRQDIITEFVRNVINDYDIYKIAFEKNTDIELKNKLKKPLDDLNADVNKIMKDYNNAALTDAEKEKNAVVMSNANEKIKEFSKSFENQELIVKLNSDDAVKNKFDVAIYNKITREFTAGHVEESRRLTKVNNAKIIDHMLASINVAIGASERKLEPIMAKTFLDTYKLYVKAIEKATPKADKLHEHNEKILSEYAKTRSDALKGVFASVAINSRKEAFEYQIAMQKEEKQKAGERAKELAKAGIPIPVQIKIEDLGKTKEALLKPIKVNVEPDVRATKYSESLLERDVLENKGKIQTKINKIKEEVKLIEKYVDSYQSVSGLVTNMKKLSEGEKNLAQNTDLVKAINELNKAVDKASISVKMPGNKEKVEFSPLNSNALLGRFGSSAIDITLQKLMYWNTSAEDNELKKGEEICGSVLSSLESITSALHSASSKIIVPIDNVSREANAFKDSIGKLNEKYKRMKDANSTKDILNDYYKTQTDNAGVAVTKDTASYSQKLSAMDTVMALMDAPDRLFEKNEKDSTPEYKEFEDKRKVLATEISEIRELIENNGKIESYKEKLDKTVDDESKAKKTLEALNDEKAEIDAKMRLVGDEKATFADAVKVLEGRRDDLNSEIQDLIEVQIPQAQADYDAELSNSPAGSADLKVLQDALKAKQNELENKNTELEKNKDELEAMNNRLETKDEELTAMVDQLGDKEKEVNTQKKLHEKIANDIKVNLEKEIEDSISLPAGSSSVQSKVDTLLANNKAEIDARYDLYVASADEALEKFKDLYKVDKFGDLATAVDSLAVDISVLKYYGDNITKTNEDAKATGHIGRGSSRVGSRVSDWMNSFGAPSP